MDGQQADAPRGLTGWLARRRQRWSDDRAMHKLYADIVEQARQPAFFTDYGIPDTPDGRFELVSLHAILAMRALRDLGPGGFEKSQALFDVMFKDVDRSLRERGVGDLSVGKWVKKIAQTFLARFEALEPALVEGDVARVRAVLERNMTGENAQKNVVIEPADSATKPRVGKLASYLVESTKTLGVGPAAAAAPGGFVWPSPAKIDARTADEVD